MFQHRNLYIDTNDEELSIDEVVKRHRLKMIDIKLDHTMRMIEQVINTNEILGFRTSLGLVLKVAVLYHDIGLKRSQQMFSDLNRFAIRPTQSLNILYDNRDDLSLIVKDVIEEIPEFSYLTDKEHTSIPNRSIALFTLSALYRGTGSLLEGLDMSYEDKKNFVVKYWKAVYKNMPEWQDVYKQKIKSASIRKESLSPLSITIKALGEIGNKLYKTNPGSWETILLGLNKINWQKNNPTWNNGIIVNGSVQLSHATQQLMIDEIKKIIM